MKDDCSASLVFDRFGALFRSVMGGIAAAVGSTYLSCTAMGLSTEVTALSVFAVSALCACSFAAVVAIVRRCCVRFEGHHSHGRHVNLLLLPYSSVNVAMRQWRGYQQSDGTALTRPLRFVLPSHGRVAARRTPAKHGGHIRATTLQM